jgi:hypothetical protein
LSQDDNEESRRAWTEGPDEGAAPSSWLPLSDDELLHRIQTLPAEAEEDDRLLEIVESNRHFFIRQEAAKRIRDRDRLFDFEDDRHVGQILVRHLTRREDLTYLERLSKRSAHVEVRSAAQVQLARLWRRLEAAAAEAGAAAPAPTAETQKPKLSVPGPAALAAPTAEGVTQAWKPRPSEEPITSAALERGGVDGSLLAWAVHFLVQPTWSDVGTDSTRELLTQTRRDLLGLYPSLVLFQVAQDAHVTINLDAGPRLPTESVRAVAAWMTAYRAAARKIAPEVAAASVRAATATVADALRESGFYAACDELEAGRR